MALGTLRLHYFFAEYRSNNIAILHRTRIASASISWWAIIADPSFSWSWSKASWIKTSGRADGGSSPHQDQSLGTERKTRAIVRGWRWYGIKALQHLNQVSYPWPTAEWRNLHQLLALLWLATLVASGREKAMAFHESLTGQVSYGTIPTIGGKHGCSRNLFTHQSRDLSRGDRVESCAGK